MRQTFFALCLVLAPLTGSPGAEPVLPIISPKQAPGNVGKRVIVQGVVHSVGSNAAGFHYLNFGADPKNQPFRAIVFPKEAPKFSGLSHYKGKRVKVRGVLRKYKEKVMIQLVSPKQIQGP